MKTNSCRALFEYWNERRGSRAAPERGDLEPGAIRQLLGDSFMIAVDAPAGYPLRLAGTRMCALFCREIKGLPFQDLFDTDGRVEIGDLIRVVTREASPIVAGVTARSDDDLPAADLELLLLPLYQRGRRDLRMLGLLVPVAVPYWLGARAVDQLELGAWRHLLPPAAPAPTLRPPPNRRRAGWVVYEGGRP
jgi:hypothetical protein